MRVLTIVLLTTAVAGCSAPKAPVRSVADLLEDPIQLQAVLDRCQANPGRAATDPECTNARAAVDRKGAQQDSAEAVKAQKVFEQRRAQLREQEDRARAAQDPAKAGFDPYTAPVAIDPAAPHKP
jgi:hypothetical protein